ncbi:MAG: TonB-dependent receptor [Candidatus Kapaibacterium sp.]
MFIRQVICYRFYANASGDETVFSFLNIIMRCVIIVLTSLLAISAFAQKEQNDTLKKIKGPEIIVTGFPAEERITPVPFIKVSREDILREAEFKDVPSLLSLTPSVVMYSQSGLDIGYPFANIRGFDQRRQSVLVNGVPENDPEDHNVYWIDIPDLTSNACEIQIQRGAGSAFYGPPAIGGSINVVTGLSGKREFNVSAGYGDYNTSKLGITLNSGLIDNKYIINARLSQLKTDGYRDASFIDLKSYRVSLARLDSNFTLQINLYGGPIKDGLNYYGIYPGDNNDRSSFTDPVARRINYSETGTYERRPQEHEEFSQPHYEAITSWDIDNRTTFYNTVFYIQGNGFFDYDGTWVYAASGIPNAAFYGLTSPYGLRYNFTSIADTTKSLGNELTRGFVGNNQFGWLPRVEYRHDSGMLTIGGEFRINRSSHWGQLLSAAMMPIDLPGDYHYNDYKGGKDIFSGFVSERYDFSKEVIASASVQLLSQEYRFFDQKPFYLDSSQAAILGVPKSGWTNYSFNVPLFFINPRVGVNINFNDFFSGFASISQTSREPRLADYYNADFFTVPNFNRNPDGSFNFNSPKIKPEHLLDVELGARLAKYLIGDDVLFSGGVTGYYMPFTDELLQTGNSDPWGSPIVANAEKVLHYGIELEGALEFGTTAALKANFTWSHNEVQQFSADTMNVGGKVPIGFPPVIAGVSFLLQPIKGLTFSLTGRYVAEMFGDLVNSDAYRNDPYAVADAMISYRENDIMGLNNVELKVQISNIFNKFYTSYVEKGTGFFVAAPRHGFATIQIGL